MFQGKLFISRVMGFFWTLSQGFRWCCGDCNLLSVPSVLSFDSPSSNYSFPLLSSKSIVPLVSSNHVALTINLDLYNIACKHQGPSLQPWLNCPNSNNINTQISLMKCDTIFAWKFHLYTISWVWHWQYNIHQLLCTHMKTNIKNNCCHEGTIK